MIGRIRIYTAYQDIGLRMTALLIAPVWTCLNEPVLTWDELCLRKTVSILLENKITPKKEDKVF